MNLEHLPRATLRSVGPRVQTPPRATAVVTSLSTLGPRATFPGPTVSGSTACGMACVPSTRGRVSAAEGEIKEFAQKQRV